MFVRRTTRLSETTILGDFDSFLFKEPSKDPLCQPRLRVLVSPAESCARPTIGTGHAADASCETGHPLRAPPADPIGADHHPTKLFFALYRS